MYRYIHCTLLKNKNQDIPYIMQNIVQSNSNKLNQDLCCNVASSIIIIQEAEFKSSKSQP